MTKMQWGIISIILFVLVLSFSVWGNWIENLYEQITFLNNNFFSETPKWFNFLMATPVIALVIFIARQLRH